MTFEPLNRGTERFEHCLRIASSGELSARNKYLSESLQFRQASRASRKLLFSREESLADNCICKIWAYPLRDSRRCYYPLRPLFVKMRLERPAGRDKRQYKNNISFKYAQSEAEGILNGQITWNKKNFR